MTLRERQSGDRKRAILAALARGDYGQHIGNAVDQCLTDLQAARQCEPQDECVCHETSTRNCPVHQNGEESRPEPVAWIDWAGFSDLGNGGDALVRHKETKRSVIPLYTAPPITRAEVEELEDRVRRATTSATVCEYANHLFSVFVDALALLRRVVK